MTQHADAWIPVAPSHLIRADDNIVAGFAGSEELALWRSPDGVVQAWENRCPHRGTRFTIGRIIGGRLSCAYHGWEFESGSGKCAFIPAHPEAPAPKNVCVATFRAAEAQGMVWVLPRAAAEAAPAGPPEVAAGRFCRTLSLRADPQRTVERLASQGFTESAPHVWVGRLAEQPLTLCLNPAQADMTLVHAWVPGDLADTDMPAVMTALRQLRAAIELS